MSKCEIPSISKLCYYCEKFTTKQDELKIREYELELDSKQNKDKPPTKKVKPPEQKKEPQKTKSDIPKQVGEKDPKSKPPTDGGEQNHKIEHLKKNKNQGFLPIWLFLTQH